MRLNIGREMKMLDKKEGTFYYDLLSKHSNLEKSQAVFEARFENALEKINNIEKMLSQTYSHVKDSTEKTNLVVGEISRAVLESEKKINRLETEYFLSRKTIIIAYVVMFCLVSVMGRDTIFSLTKLLPF